jgi:STE24 endopeptidase
MNFLKPTFWHSAMTYSYPLVFFLAFLVALSLMIALRLWLAERQIAHILAHRATVPEQFASQIELTAHQKAADYSLARTRFGQLALAVEVGVLLALTFGGGLQALHDFWRVRLDGLADGLMLIFSVLAIFGLIDLPLALYRQFGIEEKFGFNRMTIKLFFADLLKQTVLGALIGAPLLLAVLWLMTQMGALWWLYVWLVWCTFNLAILFIYPTWIAPLFNKFAPLDDAPLKARIEALLQRCGFASGGLLVMDGSKRSSHGNAYFTGFGKTKRIVFFDTLLGRLLPIEVEAVLAHELGHFKHRHVLKRIVLLFALSLAFLAALGQLIDAEWFYRGLGVTIDDSTPKTALALILFFLVVPVFTFLLTPLMSLLSRRHEFEADRYAAQNASSAALVQALVKLYVDNAATLTPDPLHSLFYDSHPPAALRIQHLLASDA